MKPRLIVIIAVVILVGILGIGGYAYWLRTHQTSSGNTETTNDNMNTSNAIQPSNINVPMVPFSAKGDRTIQKTVTYQDETLTIDTALETKTLKRREAGATEKYVVLYLSPFTQNPTSDPAVWGPRDARLRDSQNKTYASFELSIPRAANVQGGYLWFVTPVSAKGFTFVLGTGKDAATLGLGF